MIKTSDYSGRIYFYSLVLFNKTCSKWLTIIVQTSPAKTRGKRASPKSVPLPPVFKRGLPFKPPPPQDLAKRQALQCLWRETLPHSQSQTGSGWADVLPMGEGQQLGTSRRRQPWGSEGPLKVMTSTLNSGIPCASLLYCSPSFVGAPSATLLSSPLTHGPAGGMGGQELGGQGSSRS